MSNIARDPIAAWKKPVIPNTTEVEVCPGYFGSLALEWIGKELLYGTKIYILVGMRLFNTRPVEEPHPFSKGSLATVLMSKPFRSRTQQHRPRATHVACTHRGDDLSCAQATTCCGDRRACISLIHIALVFTLLGAIVYFAHSRLQKVHVRGEHVPDHAPAVDDGNVEGTNVADHAPTVDDRNIEGTDTADHAPTVDDGNFEGTNAADHPPAVDDGSVKGTDADPDSTPRISWEDKGKGVGLREYGPLLLHGSLFMGSFAQRIGQGPNARTLHPHIIPKANTTIRPKSQTAGHDIVHVDDGNVKGANEDPDNAPRISWKERGKGLQLGEYGPLMLDGLLLTGSFAQRIVQGPNDETFHISPKTNTTIHPKSQTAGDDGSETIWGSSSSSMQIFPHVMGLGMVCLQDELMSSLDPVPRPKSSPPDFPDFKCQEIPPPAPEVPPTTRSPTDGHPRCPYRDEAEANWSSASMHNPKNQRRDKGHGQEHLQVADGQRFEHKSLTPQPHYEGKRKARQDKAFNNRGEPPTRLDKQVADASVRQHLHLTWGGNRLESQSRMSVRQRHLVDL
ncbi:hypothetical protein BU17DRAFT_103504 [Hysterangium stoloniferum]|nr:hypothetical protein BU17DRAFT_103504 [Hysterangium stoloniferum]